MHGYTREEMLHLYPTEFIHPAYHATFADYMTSLRQDRSYRTSAVDVRQDGTAFPVEVNGTVFTYRGRRHALGIVRDVSDQKQVEERLREGEEQYRSVFESTSDGLIINDPETGRVVHANPAVCRMHGYTYDEFVGLHATEFIHPDFHPACADFLTTITNGGTYQTRAIDVRKDGSTFHVDVNGSSVAYRGRPHILAVVRDVTERVEAYALLEQRVEERTRELSTLLDISHNIASTLDLEPLLGLILDQLIEVVDYSQAGIWEVSEDTVRAMCYRGPLPQAEMVQLRAPLHPSLPIWPAAKLGNSVLIEDIQGDTPAAEAYRQTVGAAVDTAYGHVRSFMAVPMTLGPRIVGVVSLSHHNPMHYSERHIRLVTAVANQAAVALDNARLYAQAQDIAALEERQRLARELHDSVTQALFSMTLHARAAQMQLESEGIESDRPLASTVKQLSALTQGALAEMRALIFELRPGALQEEGLVAALRKHAAALSARQDIRIDVSSTFERVPVAVETKEHLYRLVQEALHNVTKHAQATEVLVRIQGDEVHGNVVVEIQDDGVGFDPNATAPGHLGLRTMADRARLSGGTLVVDSAMGRGTTIRVEVPISE
jgi:PAS domain S-box-containing protein